MAAHWTPMNSEGRSNYCKNTSRTNFQCCTEIHHAPRDRLFELYGAMGRLLLL